MKRWEDTLKERLAASPEYAAEYLSAVLEENDNEALHHALQHVAETQDASHGIAIHSNRELAEPDSRA